MAFDGEENYRQALADADRHESISAMVRIVGLRGALAEIERLNARVAELEAHSRPEGAAQCSACGGHGYTL
jgi:hypothetical protein